MDADLYLGILVSREPLTLRRVPDSEELAAWAARAVARLKALIADAHEPLEPTSDPMEQMRRMAWPSCWSSTSSCSASFPGDSAALLLRGTSAFNPQYLEEVRADLGLDKALPEQFLIYVTATARFEFGGSFYYRGALVSEVIASRIWPTVLLLGTVTIASAAIGLIIGIYGGWRHGSKFDVASLNFTLFLFAMPEFWFGILMLMAFAGGVGPFPAILPTGGYETP